MKRKFAGEDPKCLVEMLTRCEYANKAVKSVASMDVIEVYDEAKKSSVLIYQDNKSNQVYVLTQDTYCESLESLVRCIIDVGYGLDKNPEEFIECAREFFWMGIRNSGIFESIESGSLIAIEVTLVLKDLDKKVWNSFNKEFVEEVSEAIQELFSSKATERAESGKDSKENTANYQE